MAQKPGAPQVVVGAGTLVHNRETRVVDGILSAVSANASCWLYNSATSANLTLAVHRVAMVYAASGNSVRLPQDMLFTNGLFVSMSGNGASLSLSVQKS